MRLLPRPADELLRTGTYVYDPHEYHGPTLYYATVPVCWLTGVRDLSQMHEWMLRVVPLIFGIALIALLPLVADGLGRWPALLAALLLAVSHAFVFYSRYYIQETLLVFFTFVAPRLRAAVFAAAFFTAARFSSHFGQAQMSFRYSLK